MLNNLPARWDIEVDLVAIGSGIGGLSAAITAHESGLSAVVLERSDQVGGVTALSRAVRYCGLPAAWHVVAAALRSESKRRVTERQR